METVKEDINALIEDTIKALKTFGYTEEEVSKIREFLDRRFSPNGIIDIASIFTFAKKHDPSISAERILEECEKEWKRNWYYQHPDIKGDPEVGTQNKRSLENIYEAIGVPSPAHQKKD